MPSPTKGREFDAARRGEEEPGHGETCEIEAEPVEADRWELAPIVIAEDAHEPLPEDVRNWKRPEPAPASEEAPISQTAEEMRERVRADEGSHERSERTQEPTAGGKEIRTFIDLLALNLETPIGRGPDYRRLPRRE
ncbi:hypothetical protein [Aquisphaera insulae]|uniref:hypothetical protein n=1 Tax=Aquisphaera insulae TaxID=2712864 RepID=UPI0013EBBE06|nr:hypothetical protein [Aquisphaera insulae]